LGIHELVTEEEIFKRAFVVSNHLPDKDNNKKILTKAHFASMREGAVFINTGRGAQVDEAGLIEVLKARPDLTALLDVQEQEPPPADSELYTLPNVHLSSHIAGAYRDESHRMADFMIEEFLRWQAGEPLKYQVDAAYLKLRA
jgi:phosphoglycerate dehydrogenase-like enzyme